MPARSFAPTLPAVVFAVATGFCVREARSAETSCFVSSAEAARVDTARPPEPATADFVVLRPCKGVVNRESVLVIYKLGSNLQRTASLEKGQDIEKTLVATLPKGQSLGDVWPTGGVLAFVKDIIFGTSSRAMRDGSSGFDAKTKTLSLNGDVLMVPVTLDLARYGLDPAAPLRLVQDARRVSLAPQNGKVATDWQGLHAGAITVEQDRHASARLNLVALDADPDVKAALDAVGGDRSPQARLMRASILQDQNYAVNAVSEYLQEVRP